MNLKKIILTNEEFLLRSILTLFSFICVGLLFVFSGVDFNSITLVSFLEFGGWVWFVPLVIFGFGIILINSNLKYSKIITFMIWFICTLISLLISFVMNFSEYGLSIFLIFIISMLNLVILSRLMLKK